jgi:hypothetical protein
MRERIASGTGQRAESGLSYDKRHVEHSRGGPERRVRRQACPICQLCRRNGDLTSFNGLLGIIDHDRGFFLTDVFLDDSVPGGSGPPVLNFTGAGNFMTLSPQLFQTFFIGNGLINGGTTEQIFFVAPPAAEPPR